MVLLSIHNTCFKWWIRKKSQFYTPKIFASCTFRKWFHNLSLFNPKPARLQQPALSLSWRRFLPSAQRVGFQVRFKHFPIPLSIWFGFWLIQSVRWEIREFTDLLQGLNFGLFQIENSHHVCFSQLRKVKKFFFFFFRDHYYLWETMTHIRMLLKHLCLSGMLGIIQSKIQSTLDTSNFKGLGKICRVISSSR